MSLPALDPGFIIAADERVARSRLRKAWRRSVSVNPYNESKREFPPRLPQSWATIHAPHPNNIIPESNSFRYDE